jgi:hypothetical protein
MSKVYLFVNGPAHGRMIAVPDNEFYCRIPIPAKIDWPNDDAIYDLEVATYSIFKLPHS